MLVLGMRMVMMMCLMRRVVGRGLMARVCPSNCAGAGDVREQQGSGCEQAYARSESSHVNENTPFAGSRQSVFGRSRDSICRLCRAYRK